MSEEHFPLRLTLKQFFNDERQRILVSAEGQRPVRWLLRKLRRVVALPSRSRLALLVDGYLVPHDEPLELLRNASIVEIVPVSVVVEKTTPAVDKTTPAVDKATPAVDKTTSVPLVQSTAVVDKKPSHHVSVADTDESDYDETDAPSSQLQQEPVKTSPSLGPADAINSTIDSCQPSSPPAAVTPSVEDLLESQKRQALLLLEQLSNPVESPALKISEKEVSERPRKRRRVRRRRRITPLEINTINSESASTEICVTNLEVNSCKSVEKLLSIQYSDDSAETSDVWDFGIDTILQPKAAKTDDSKNSSSVHIRSESWGVLESSDNQIVRCASVRAPRLVRAESPVRDGLEAKKPSIETFKGQPMCVE